MADNRRTSTRHEVLIDCKLDVDGAVNTDCQLVNLSLGGALIAGVRHKMGQRLQVTFTVPASDHTIEIGATVRWADVKGVGIQFDGLRARDVWALNEYFKLLG